LERTGNKGAGLGLTNQIVYLANWLVCFNGNLASLLHLYENLFTTDSYKFTKDVATPQAIFGLYYKTFLGSTFAISI